MKQIMMGLVAVAAIARLGGDAFKKVGIIGCDTSHSTEFCNRA